MGKPNIIYPALPYSIPARRATHLQLPDRKGLNHSAYPNLNKYSIDTICIVVFDLWVSGGGIWWLTQIRIWIPSPLTLRQPMIICQKSLAWFWTVSWHMLLFYFHWWWYLHTNCGFTQGQYMSTYKSCSSTWHRDMADVIRFYRTPHQSNLFMNQIPSLSYPPCAHSSYPL